MAAKRERGLKKLADGRWRYSWKYQGRYHRMIAPSYAIATASLSKIRAQIAEGRYLEKEARCNTSFEKAVADFLVWSKANLRPGSYRRDCHFAAKWRAFPRFKKDLDAVTVQDVEAYRSQRAATVGKRTCDYDLSRLRRLFALAEQWGLSKGNPAKGVKMFHADNRRDVFLTPEEEARILEAAPSFLRPAIVFSIQTGLRQGELLSLTWGQVDLDRRSLTITAEKAKGKKTRHVPLNVVALDALKSQPRGLRPDTPVFPALASMSPGYLTQKFPQIVKAAKVEKPGLCWHSLRHTFASRLVQSGVNLLTVKELLGHSTLDMVLRYAHLADGNLKTAVDTLIEASKLQKSCTCQKEGFGGEDA
jgi:integrase